MKKFRHLLLGLVLLTNVANAKSWVLGGGLGLTFSPTLFMLNPQMEYPYSDNLYIGPMMQAGLGDAVLFTFSGTARFIFGNDPRLKPFAEGALGLGVGNGATSSVGVHIMLGMGFDYVIQKNLSLGTTLRMNFCPPLDTFFVSWPVVMARYHL